MYCCTVAHHRLTNLETRCNQIENDSDPRGSWANSSWDQQV